MEAHNKILQTSLSVINNRDIFSPFIFIKIYNLQYERDTEWPEKLQPAVFAANTQFKRSTSFTPFRLMFGRDCDPFGFLKLVIGSLEDIFEDDVSDDGKSVIINTSAVVFIKLVYH